jgi:hypothetical protein
MVPQVHQVLLELLALLAQVEHQVLLVLLEELEQVVHQVQVDLQEALVLVDQQVHQGLLEQDLILLVTQDKEELFYRMVVQMQLLLLLT